MSFQVEWICSRGDLQVTDTTWWIEVCHHKFSHVTPHRLVRRIGRELLDHSIDFWTTFLAFCSASEQGFALGGFAKFGQTSSLELQIGECIRPTLQQYRRLRAGDIHLVGFEIGFADQGEFGAGEF